MNENHHISFTLRIYINILSQTNQDRTNNFKLKKQNKSQNATEGSLAAQFSLQFAVWTDTDLVLRISIYKDNRF